MTNKLMTTRPRSTLSVNEFIQSDLCGFVLKLIIEGASEREAVVAAGMGKDQLTKYKKNSEFLRLIAQAKAKSKLQLVGAVTNVAVKGSTVKETVESYRRVEFENGESGMIHTDTKIITREIPPDGKVGIQLLKVRFPEDFGDIKRIDLRKIGHESQVDLDDVPKLQNAPKAVLDMILNGDGVYEMDSDDLEEDVSKDNDDPLEITITNDIENLLDEDGGI